MCKAVLVLVSADYINSLMDILIVSIGYVAQDRRLWIKDTIEQKNLICRKDTIN